ncbi:MAG TPA: zinc dependent phospholipase C family protein [Acidobacteriaceae bacterium]|nr:zinc dependent phospholipase C family protein [Acidobacteriaceae bacterium]
MLKPPANHQTRCRGLLALALILLLLIPPQPAHAYSVLSHEQVVDLAWKSHIIPLLQRRYPGITPEQIKEAHAYAYGGAIIQDIGYYPFGSKLLSDMTHYVRSGDFVSNLIREAQNPNEYAFALGALAHYTSDALGHPAVNRATASEYPKLRRRYGPVVTYDENPRAHLQTEFGFDVLEVVQHRYAPEAFHDFIGFQVAKPVFERAFFDTYGLPLNQVLTKEDLAIGTYRRTVSILLPKMTQVAVADYGKKMQQAEPTFVPKKLIYRVNKADYQKRFGNSYHRPGFGTRVLAFLLKLVPKIGPLKDLDLRVPSADAQKAFLTGMDTVVDHYDQSLDHLAAEPPDHPSSLHLPSLDLDTGKPTAPAEYALADQTYARYLALLVKPRPPAPPPTPSAPWPPPEPVDVHQAGSPSASSQSGSESAKPSAPAPAPAPPPDTAQQPAPKPTLQPIDPAIRADIERYFARTAPGELLLKKQQWKKLPKDLETLKQLPAAPLASAGE